MKTNKNFHHTHTHKTSAGIDQFFRALSRRTKPEVFFVSRARHLTPATTRTRTSSSCAVVSLLYHTWRKIRELEPRDTRHWNIPRKFWEATRIFQKFLQLRDSAKSCVWYYDFFHRFYHKRNIYLKYINLHPIYCFKSNKYQISCRIWFVWCRSWYVWISAKRERTQISCSLNRHERIKNSN